MSDSNLYLYNTLSRKAEVFTPLQDKKVGIYCCGPTVYDFAHIGHIRRYVLDDVLVRLLRYLDYQVTHVMNVTDVGHLVSDSDTGEDKLEKGAKREGKTAWEVAKFYEAHFFQTMDAMGIKRPDIVCRATEHIKEQIALIQKLEQKGFIYVIADGVYFDSSKFPQYGKLAKLNQAGLEAGARVEMVPGKKHSTDFALWKFSPKGAKRDMEWESPWSFGNAQDKVLGFPGWHIECSAMSMKYLGESFDIHTGGIDHIPIHHTNEIAQSEAATGKQFVRYWVHHNFLLVDSQKMSKSLGNFYTLDDVIKKGFKPMSLRYLFLQTHYRQESNFTYEALKGAQTALEQLLQHVIVIKQQSEHGERTALSDEKLDKVNSLRKRFKDALRDDLNTPQALAIVWEIVKSNIPPGDKYDLLKIADELLGIGLDSVPATFSEVEIPAQIIALAQKRQQFRKEKKWIEADQVRKDIDKLGWIVEDTGKVYKLKRKG